MASEIGLRTSLLSNVIDVAPAKRLGSSGSMEPEIWTENWRRNEFSYLRDRLELVERQLRRRTALLAVAVVLLVGSAAGLAIIPFVDTPWGNSVRSGVAGWLAPTPGRSTP